MFYYSQTQGIERFCKGLNPEQIKQILIWMNYAERHVMGKVQMAPGGSQEKESWRHELGTINAYQGTLRDKLAKPEIITP